MRSVFRRGILPVLALAAFGIAPAGAVSLSVIQPDEAASKDVLVYEFDVPGIFGIPTPPRSTNLDSDTLNAISPPPVPFGNFLGAAETDPFSLTEGGPLRMHGTRSLLEFDLASTGLKSKQVGRATLNLYALPALPAFESPRPDKPVTTELRRVREAWDEQEVTWDSRPKVANKPATTVVQDGVDRWVQFEVTDLVKDWLDDASRNFGIEISQQGVVEMEVPGDRDRYFASLYASSAFADPALRPFVEVAPVPVPPAIALMAAGMMMLGGLRLRRQRPAA